MAVQGQELVQAWVQVPGSAGDCLPGVASWGAGLCDAARDQGLRSFDLLGGGLLLDRHGADRLADLDDAGDQESELG